MLHIQDTLISLDLFEQFFCCDLAGCKGSCCVEGDSGAPLEGNEEEALKAVLPQIWADLSTEARAVIDRQGVATTDCEGERVTSLVGGKDCVFTCYDEKGICYCAVEKAWREGRSSFMKPISCHLYPIRVKQFPNYKAVNYQEWSICAPGNVLGRKLGLPLYQFLKEPLIRKFGQAWYDELCEAARLLEQTGGRH
jgi:hypothetical protein